MLTTISLGGRLARRVRREASDRGVSVRASIAGTLDDALRQRERAEPPPFRLVTVRGVRPRPGVDLDRARLAPRMMKPGTVGVDARSGSGELVERCREGDGSEDEEDDRRMKRTTDGGKRARLHRSALFVPGHRPDWVPKALRSGADMLILDLEDSVPVTEKARARSLVRESLEALAAEGRDRSVRINGLETGHALGDLEAIVCPALQAVRLPKVESAADLHELGALLTHLEMRAGMEPGSVATPLDLETADAMRDACDILRASPRATSMMLGCGPGGDAARAVGYRWTKDGNETRYLRSKAVLDARAAGIEYPLVTSWWDIPDLDGLRADAALNRRFGFRGMVVMHPSHVPIVNEAFTPDEAELAHARGLIAAMEAAEREGNAAVTYEGNMVDYAMVTTARELLDLAASIDAHSGG